MSIVGLRKAFRKKMSLGFGRFKIRLSIMEILFYLIVITFVVGAYFQFGGPGTSGKGKKQRVERNVSKNIATVNGDVISRREFRRRYYRTVQSSRRISQQKLVTLSRRVKMQVFDGMVLEQAMIDAVHERGITVSSAEVNQRIDEQLEKMLDARFPTRERLVEYLRKHKKSYEDYKAQQRKKLLENRDEFKKMVLFDKLEKDVKSRVNVTDADLKDKYTKIKARHILIKPQRLKQNDKAEEKQAEQKDAKDAKEQDEDTDKKDTDTEKDYDALAKKRAEKLLEKLKNGAEFDELARKHSHDMASAKNGGLLHGRPPRGAKPGTEPPEYFGRGQMLPAFDKAAFELEAGKISDVVKTRYGYHIIKLLDRKVEYPDDFKDNKKKYRAKLLEEKKKQAWKDFKDSLKKQADIKVHAPEIAAYRALKDDNRKKAVGLLAKTVENDPINDGAKYQLAMLLKKGGQNVKAIDLLKELAEAKEASRSPQVHMELANLLAKQGNQKEAVETYSAASQWAEAYDYQNMFLHRRLKSKFKELGKNKLAKQEQKWIDEFTAHQKQKRRQMQIPASAG